jgi:hypothetical protein
MRIAVVAVACAGALGAPASAATRSCGAEQRLSSGKVFMIRATGVGCATAKSVAGGWYHVQFMGRSGPANTVVDTLKRTWTCRITKQPGTADRNTSVSCSHSRSVVRFKQRP